MIEDDCTYKDETDANINEYHKMTTSQNTMRLQMITESKHEELVILIKNLHQKVSESETDIEPDLELLLFSLSKMNTCKIDSDLFSLNLRIVEDPELFSQHTTHILTLLFFLLKPMSDFDANMELCQFIIDNCIYMFQMIKESNDQNNTILFITIINQVLGTNNSNVQNEIYGTGIFSILCADWEETYPPHVTEALLQTFASFIGSTIEPLLIDHISSMNMFIGSLLEAEEQTDSLLTICSLLVSHKYLLDIFKTGNFIQYIRKKILENQHKSWYFLQNLLNMDNEIFAAYMITYEETLNIVLTFVSNDCYFSGPAIAFLIDFHKKQSDNIDIDVPEILEYILAILPCKKINEKTLLTLYMLHLLNDNLNIIEEMPEDTMECTFTAIDEMLDCEVMYMPLIGGLIQKLKELEISCDEANNIIEKYEDYIM